METPLIRLGEDGESAPRLNYSIPEATSYVGTSVISIPLDPDFLNRETHDQIQGNMEEKVPGRTNPVSELPLANVELTAISDRVGRVTSPTAAATVFEQHTNTLIYRPKESLLGFAGEFEVLKPRPRPSPNIQPKILFYEKLQVSSFLGNYGAGRVIKTFSLLPGEKTKLFVRSFDKTKTVEGTTVNVGSSILDSVTEEAAVDFEHSIQSETSSKFTETEADILTSQQSSSSKQGEGRAKVLWGLVDAGGGGASSSSQSQTGEWGTRQAREEFAKSVSNALFKHSSRASSKRNVEINTSSETSTTSTQISESESTIERTIENVNVSRTLNFVFRQMVQEFISAIHLIDVKIALYDESSGPYAQYAIHELDQFLDDYVSDDDAARNTVRDGIIRELFFIFNYQDEPRQFLEQASLDYPTGASNAAGVEFPERLDYLRVNKSLRERLEDREFIEVPGVILNENTITMRTDGVIVDIVLGQANGLDDYATRLQRETVRELEVKNALAEFERSEREQIQEIIGEGDVARSEIFRTIHCCPDHLCVGTETVRDRPAEPRRPVRPGEDERDGGGNRT